jgi:branched-subunit amino acid ABC-type transport system permease component
MPTLATGVDIALNSLVLGGVFLIVASGLNIIYGLSRVMNLAHGSLYALGAYFGYTFLRLGIPFWAIFLLAPVVTAILGVLMERVIIRPIRNRPIVFTLILTYGLMFFLDGCIRYFWGTEVKFMALPQVFTKTIYILGTNYPVYRLFVLLVIAATIVGLILLLERTKFGAILRAASYIPEMVSCLGISMNVVNLLAFILGCVMAGIAGILAGPLYNLDPIMGHQMLISSFVVVVVGGLGTVRGSIIAAILIGLVQTLAEFFVTDLAMVIVYLLMAVVLAVSPKGILGEGRFE